jgi:hypothetical protein
VKLIPLYDDTAPIACSADATELAARVEQIERMHRQLAHIERTEHGVLLRFPHDAELEADVRQFASDEKNCCGFWGFAVTTSDDAITLQWDAPPTMHDYMDDLLTKFENEEPITALSGLL